ALLVIQAFDRTLFRRETVRGWLLAAVTFFAAWNAVEALKPYADLRGPGTRGQLLHGLSGSEVTNLADRVDIALTEWPGRAATMAGNFLPRLLGATPINRALTTEGRVWMRWLLGIAAMIVVLRLLSWLRSPVTPATSLITPRLYFAWYLFLIGLLAAL